MSYSIETTFDIVIKPSAAHRYWQYGLHALALVACCANGLPSIVQCLLLVVVLGTCYRSHRQCRNVLYHLRYNSLQGWSLSRDGETYHALVVLPSTMTSVWFVTLNYRFAGRSKAVKSMSIFLNDLHPDDFRRLLVRLRLYGS